MSSAAGPSIATSGLVLDFDAANTRSYGYPTVEVLVVAGGGGGGRYGGGAGGGGLIYNAAFSVTTSTAVTVGAGGAGWPGDAQSGGTAANGSNSVFSTLTAIGGGGGGLYNNGGATNGSSGASGGSSGGNGSNGPGRQSEQSTLNAPTSGQGNYGGYQSTGYGTGGGGGGGAGGVGASGVAGGPGGVGGIGKQYGVSGTLTYYAGGGSGTGGTTNILVPASLGGGGAGLPPGSTSTTIDAIVNTGGGGGGGSDNTISGVSRAGNGGSGIVIVRYPGGQKASGGTITNANGFTIHTFTASGTFTPGTHWVDVSSTSASAVGTLTNGPTYSSANGGVIVFDGSNDYISVTKTLTTPITISGFLKYTDQTKTAGMYLNSYPHAVLGISINRSGGGQLVVYIGNGTTWLGSPSITSSVNMTVDVWYHLTFTSNGTTSDLYLNGVNVGTVGHAPSGWGNYFAMGMIVQTGEYYKGSIGTTQIYSRALSAVEVKQNFNATRTRYGL